MIIVALAGVVGLSIVTQNIASQFKIPTGLATPLIGEFYSPFKGIGWSLKIGSAHNKLVAYSWMFGVFGFLGMLAVGWVVRIVVTLHSPKNLDGHGTARFANREDAVKSGLLDGTTSDRSLIIGGWKEPDKTVSYLAHNGPESVLLFAPARSGKGVALVVPVLLSYAKSCLALDVKGELWEQTAGYRQSELKNKVLFHDPSSMEPSNARFNAIDEIRVGTPYAIKDAQMVAEYLIPSGSGDEDKGSATAHFIESARSLIVGVMLYEKYLTLDDPDANVNIAAILSALSDPLVDPREYLAEMKNYDDEDCSCIRIIQETASEMLNKEEREFSGVLSSVTTPLTKFRSPILAAATAKSDFNIMQLVDMAEPMTLYLTIRPSDRDLLSNYFALIVNLVCRRMTEVLPSKENPRHELLLMLDEFSSLPPLPIVQQSMDVMPGYGVKAYIVLQDYATLTRLYGESETISSNCKVVIAYTPGKYATAELLSSMTGTTTIIDHTISKQKKLVKAVTDETEGESIHSRPLLTADEIMRLEVPVIGENNKMVEPGASLIFTRGINVIKGVQTPWFFDDEMKQRASFPCPESSDKLNA